MANIATTAKDQAFTTALSDISLGDFRITVVSAAWTFSTKSTGNKEISTKMYIGVDGGAKTGTVQNDGTSAIETTITFTPSHS